MNQQRQMIGKIEQFLGIHSLFHLCTCIQFALESVSGYTCLCNVLLQAKVLLVILFKPMIFNFLL